MKFAVGAGSNKKDGGEDCSWMPYTRQPTYLWWIVDFSDFAFEVCPLGKN